MASFKDRLSKSVAAINVKTNKYVEESKAKTYIATLSSEISSLYELIGKMIYEQWENGHTCSPPMEPILHEIRKKQLLINEQNKKLQKIQTELSNMLGDDASVFCPKCGTKNPSGNLFCTSCGNKLTGM